MSLKFQFNTMATHIRMKFGFGLIAFSMCSGLAFAQNPLIRDQFTADPTARVFNDKIYVYPSHDIICEEGVGRPNWFCMEDYHVFSSENLTDWNDHGEILNQKEVPWADPQAYSMWAPDCVEKGGNYYFYFPTKAKESEGFSIGVAIGEHPEGPFIPQEKSIAGVAGIDPNVFIDDDGQAYMYWSGRDIFVAKLKPNMIELASEPQVIQNLPAKGLKEGPFMFARKGNYYLTYPHVENKTERLEYAMGASPMGPFKVTGVIMDESPTGCWTNHQSILEFKNQWYLFYHHNDLSPEFDKNRSIRADSLSFNTDGTIKKVIPSLRGIGMNTASDTLQIDRYSAKSTTAQVNFNNPDVTFEGWNILLNAADWVRYNTVNFDKPYQVLKLKVRSAAGAVLRLNVEGLSDGMATVDIPKTSNWSILEFPISPVEKGVYDLTFAVNSGALELDWVQFGH